jgi:hypothetical protein
MDLMRERARIRVGSQHGLVLAAKQFQCVQPARECGSRLRYARFSLNADQCGIDGSFYLLTAALS